MSLFKNKYVAQLYILVWVLGILVCAYSDEIVSIPEHIFGEGSEWFWAMTQTIVVGITLLLIYSQLKAQHSKNMLDTIAIFDMRWDAKSMRDSRRKVCQKYLENDFDNINFLEGLVLDYFEQMGWYLKKRVYSRDVIWEFHSYYIMAYWRLAEQLIQNYRSQEEDNTYYEWFEWLHNEMIKENLDKGIKQLTLTDAKLKKFINDEIAGEEIKPAG
jgi:hypothetical protein